MSIRHRFVKAVLDTARRNSSLDRMMGELFRRWYEHPSASLSIPQRQRLDAVFEASYDLPFPPTHYYSPLPDVAVVKRNMARWYRETSAPGIDWNIQGQIELAHVLHSYVPEVSLLPSYEQVAREGYGQGYGVVEAQILYAMVRHFSPAKVIEVGSGVSTVFILMALRANQEKSHAHGALTCIEPYPSQRLLEMARANQVQLLSCEVQDVKLETFETLSSGDLLFIDSSHVSKKDSDVDYLYLEVLPRLQKGVVIHIHDMPFPMPGLPKDHVLFDTFLFWNEASVVRAFLLFNEAFKVLMCQSYLYWKRPEVLQLMAPAYDATEFPASLWLRRVS